ncbi:MAG TPA: discoidin domain-containing protein [Polyangiaceae bacterium]|nr:discoidin domain-containing protein [Polyangiaceae bacterium]
MKSNDLREKLAQTSAAVREFFSMRGALARSAALDPETRASARVFESSARSRLSGADALWAAGQLAAALELYREATLLFARALLSAEGPTRDLGSSDPAALFSALSGLLERDVRSMQASADVLRPLGTLARADTFELDRIAALHSPPDIREFAWAVHSLSERLDLRTPSAVQFRRVQRAGVALAMTAVVLFGCARWAFPPVDLALKKPVTASSHAYDTQPEGAVDGLRYGQLGFHSANERSPWLLVDLGQMTPLHEVRVFGRPECCYDQSIPLALEGSADGVTFTEIARRSEPFTQYEPWVVRPDAASARFVRLRTLRHSFLVVSELEVY